MIRPETVIALRAYTSLPKGIQGILMRRRQGYELSGEASEDEDITKLMSRATQRVHCVSTASFHSGLMDPGTPASGPFVFRGCSLGEKDGTIVAVARALSGPVPAGFADAKAPSLELLVSFRSADVTQCWGGEEVLFGTTSVLGALAPPWAYVRPVVDGSVARILAPCTNGCYLLERLDAGDQRNAAPSDAEATYGALLRMDVVAILGGRVPSSAPCIYRLARNAVVVGPEGSHDKVAALQATLRIPSQPTNGKLVATTAFTLQRGVAAPLTDFPDVSAKQLAAAAGDGTSVFFQPLERWQMPRRRLSLHIVLAPAGPQVAMRDIVLRPSLGDRTLTGVSIHVRAPFFNAPRPGETDRSQTEQLERIVQSAADQQLASTDVSSGQGALDAFTRSMTAEVEAKVNAAQLFGAKVTARIKTDLITTHGESVRLPEGGTAVIPEYALSETSTRICVFTGGLAALGVKASFHPWKQIRQGFAF